MMFLDLWALREGWLGIVKTSQDEDQEVFILVPAASRPSHFGHV